jgi:hypothetical protein
MRFQPDLFFDALLLPSSSFCIAAAVLWRISRLSGIISTLCVLLVGLVGFYAQIGCTGLVSNNTPNLGVLGVSVIIRPNWVRWACQ